MNAFFHKQCNTFQEEGDKVTNPLRERKERDDSRCMKYS